MDQIKITAEVQGLPFDEDAWRTVAEQMVTIGKALDRHVEGISYPGRLFFDTAVNVDTLTHMIRHLNEHQEYLPPYKVVCDCPDMIEP